MSLEKPNLELMNRELHPESGYKGLIEIEKLLKDLATVNSNFAMSKQELVKRLSIAFYDDAHRTFSKDGKFDIFFNGLKKTIDRKIEIINQLRIELDQMEKEAIVQEDVIGGYQHQFGKLSQS
jgi:hypothetical protein